jgi:ABC-type nickel/cobalt efflux system permease component RcnA
MDKIIKIQRELNSKLSQLIRQTRENSSISTVLFALIISFIYGMIHSLGPGHGKIFATSYFLSNRSRYLNGIVLGYSTGLIHALSALISVTILYFVLSGGSMKNIDELNVSMQKISYFVIILVGIFLLFSALKHKHKEKKKKNRSLLSIALAVGMVPCPGTTIVLVFSMTLGVYLFGTILAAAMALGMGTTISFAGLSAIFLNKQGKKLSSNIMKSGKILEKVLNIAGAVVIMVLGLILFVGTF